MSKYKIGDRVTWDTGLKVLSGEVAGINNVDVTIRLDDDSIPVMKDGEAPARRHITVWGTSPKLKLRK